MRKIFANYDGEGVYVYQAFTPSTVASALRRGTFDRGFNLERMTWIKPSFGWMLYRSGYASKHNQEAILKIKLTHAGFLEILRQSVETSFNPRIYSSESDWTLALKHSEVRHQWDPERNLRLQKLDRRAIQIGIRGATVKRYVNDWIISLEEVTQLAKALHQAIRQQQTDLPVAPIEIEYPVSAELQRSLGINP
ncbi:MAG: DUF4291 domain-containing protein [Acidobacteriota bacterium]